MLIKRSDSIGKALIVLLTGSRCGEAKRPKPLGFELYLSRTPFGPRITGWKPLYPADHLIPASDAAPRRLRLRSANLNRLTVPRCGLTTYGCEAFYHASPTVWN